MPIRPVEIMEKHTYDPDKDGLIAAAQIEMTSNKVAVGQGLGSSSVEENKPEAGDLGLSYYGKVTTYTDTTHFKASALAGYGDTFFKGYFVYVVRDAGGAGAAPQHEQVEITGYASADGTFTHDEFTTPLAVDDEILVVLLPAAVSKVGISDDVMAQALAQQSHNTTSWIKKKEVRIHRSGNYRCKWETAVATAPRTVYTRIRINDVEVGNQHSSTSESFIAQIEDLNDVANGDLLQLWMRSSEAGIVYARNFYLCGEINPYLPKVILD